MSTQNFLLEIGSEEIPAGYIQNAESYIKKFADDWLRDKELGHHTITTYATPRRLVLFISDLEEKQKVSEKLMVGPPAKISFDNEGNLTKAGLGFAKSQNVDPKQLFKHPTDKGDYLAVHKTIGGEKTENLLPAFASEIISKIPFPKSMYWESSQFRYARPIRWIVCYFGKQSISFEIAGIKSGNETWGHPIRSSKPIGLDSADINDYKNKLSAAFVIVDPIERATMIREALKSYGTHDNDTGLLETVTYLVENPSVIQGDFAHEYLNLPQEVLITSMKHHQKYFPMIDADGNLKPHFLSIHNSGKEAEPNIKIGNERVLNARLSDAQFFWKEDTKTSLLDKNKKLSGLLFQAKLENYDKKTERIVGLAGELAKQLNFSISEQEQVKKSATLCKIDLVTEMVKEFPELQGVMGKLYALHDKENLEVAQAIQDHYLPKGNDSTLPQNNVGAIVSIADKLDTIVGCYGVGLIPSGSEDPFALRRAGNGIIRIVLAHKDWTFSLKFLLNYSAELYKSTVGIDTTPALAQVMDFLGQRLRGSLSESAISYDTANAILTQFPNDINDVYLRADALHKMRTLEGFIPLTIAFKRVINILKQARDKFKIHSFGSPDASKFTEEAENKLYKDIQKITLSIQQSVQEKRYMDSLQTIAELRPSVDFFFDKVMVMVEDETIRKNRLALLEQLETQFRQLADFSQLVVEES